MNKTTKDTEMTITNISGGIKFNVDGMFGITPTSSKASSLSGYDIQSKTTGNGVDYKTIILNTDFDVDDPANLVVTVDYTQTQSYDEVDMDVEFKDIPSGTEMGVNASNSHFTLSRQNIEGSGSLGKQGIDVGNLVMCMTLSLWFEKPEKLIDTSTITLSMSKISGSSGPVTKTLLEKIVINLTNNK